MFKQLLTVVICTFCVFSCEKPQLEKLTKGIYKSVIAVQDNEELPFIFEVVSENELHIFNADETIIVDEIAYKNDSVYIKMPAFEGIIVGNLKNDTLIGYFKKPNLNRTVSLKAFKNNNRFETVSKPITNITGNWETVFSPGIESEESIAKGIFKQEINKITGTFRTPTGDYRYLEGVLDGNQLKLSTFDGAHAFYFKATVTDSTMNGVFYSGDHWKESFIAKLNNDFELPDANTLTYLKEGYDSVAFSFPDETGNMVSLEDERFKDKVVVVQILGTWCPNCLDETVFYSGFYKKYKDKDIEFVGLAFEYVKTQEQAFKNIKRLKDRVGVEYPILLAQTGTTNKTKAQEKLPMLNHVLSYPTSIFIDKKSKVRKIHTGFNGPATGEKYVNFVSEFESFISELLSE